MYARKHLREDKRTYLLQALIRQSYRHIQLPRVP